ncbi:MAG: UvrD-helicase domain-containing protein, partial [Clostridia bacterium]|nr:UvrD-helicase domain-containing protein [Clostridia bacterium]
MFCSREKEQFFKKYYEHLNGQQQKAVFETQGPLLVIAGAGSGKTTVLVHKISHLMQFGQACDTPMPQLND